MDGLHVGTCGWQYRSWRGTWYPEGLPQRSWLAWYATRFPCVEVDSSFYRLPTRTATAGWATQVPAGFGFVPKMSRYLTHLRRLRDPEEPIARFVDRMEPLGEFWSATLLQLPPDLRRDDGLLGAVLDRWPRERRLAVEFRHRSWFDDDVFEALSAAGATLTLTDRRNRPLEPLVRTADWCYVRLHEGTSTPRPCYGDRPMRSWAERIAALWGGDATGFVVFNNDPCACAPPNAERFAVLAARAGLAVRPPPSSPPPSPPPPPFCSSDSKPWVPERRTER
jgi:uncharacterized protein YecE (DUF72 family)